MTPLPGWTRVAARRGVQALTVALLVGSICFVAVRALPGDMAMRIAAGRYGYDLVNAAAADSVRAELGLDRPALAQFADWLFALARLDLGRSLVSGDRVADELAHLLGHTVTLALCVLMVGLLLGPPLGWLAGLRPGGLADRFSLVAAAALRALPGFALGIVLILVFGVWLGWLPAAGYGSARDLILPALSVGLVLAATAARVARDATASVTASAFFLFARIKGLSDGTALLRHGVRNAAVPVLAYLGVQLAHLVEGVVIAETLFAWPGIGHAMVHAIIARDVPMVQGTALVLGLMFVLMNAAVDALCLAVDPRRRSLSRRAA